MRRIGSVVLLVLVALAASTLPASAAGRFGSSGMLANCAPGQAAASIAADGKTRGFIPCAVGFGDGPIRFFRDAPGLPVATGATPYVGQVLATAWDGVDAMYIVYTQGRSLKIAKRVESTGTYSAATVLATGGDTVPFTADVVASNGQWWAVWSEQVGPGGDSAQTELFQRHTLLGVQPRTQITTSPDINDFQPSLGYYAGRGTLVWSKLTETEEGPGPSTLWIAGTTGGALTARMLAGVGQGNDSPDSVNINGTTYVTWNRDGTVVQADNSAGQFVSHTFATMGAFPKIGASGGKVFVAWTTGYSTVYYAERSVSGAWSAAVLGSSPGLLVAVLGQGGKARVIYTEGTRDRIRKQI